MFSPYYSCSTFSCPPQDCSSWFLKAKSDMSICSLKTSGSQPPLRKNPHSLQGHVFCLFAYLLTSLHLLFPWVVIGRLWVAPSQGNLPNMPHPFARLLVRAIGHRMSSCHVIRFSWNPAIRKVHLRCENLTYTTKQCYIRVLRVQLPDYRWAKKKTLLLAQKV